MRIAVVTGASCGLGAEFIKNLKNDDLDEIWAIARRSERLKDLEKLTSVPIRALPLDLTKNESIDSLCEILKEERPDIHILINAAGFGKITATADMSREDLDNMIDLNCKAAADITLIAIPYMKKGSRILEICSSSAFQPLQYMNVYAASKAFLYRFSRALRIELFPKGISVTAVCPYWIKNTEFISKARSEGKKNVRRFPFASKKENVARQALIDSKLKLPVSTPGIICTLHRMAAKIIPSFIMCFIWDGFRLV